MDDDSVSMLSIPLIPADAGTQYFGFRRLAEGISPSVALSLPASAGMSGD